MTLEKIIQYIPVGAIAYLCFALAVNVGYINIVGDWIVPFFSVADTFQVNILVLQKLFALLSIVVGIAFLLIPILALLVELLERLFPRWNPDFETKINSMFEHVRRMTWQGYVSLFVVLVTLGFFATTLEDHGFFFSLLPVSLFMILQIAYLRYLRRVNHFSEVAFIVALFINFLGVGYQIGKSWARDDRISEAKVLSVISENGACMTRRVVRVVGWGYVFYNDYSKNYEFVRAETIKGFTPNKTCAELFI